MITIKKISINEIPELVKMSYEKDEDFFTKYYANNSSYMACVNAELFKIYEMAESEKLNYYKVIYQKKAIGYVITFGDFLYSFCINIKYRKKEILLHWWDKIQKLMPKKFGCYLYKKNERAIEFLKKNRMKVIDENNEIGTVTLMSY